MDAADLADKWYELNEADDELPYCEHCAPHNRHGVRTDDYGVVCISCYLQMNDQPFDPRQAA